MKIPPPKPRAPVESKEYFAYFMFNAGYYGNCSVGEFRDTPHGRSKALVIARKMLNTPDNQLKRLMDISTDPNFKPLKL